MCTVTFWPTTSGFRVGMNRDEQRSRPPALGPGRHESRGISAIHPAETSGGTWCSVNDRGVGLTLINWYSVTARPPEPVTSRGEIIVGARSDETSGEVGRSLSRLPLKAISPFRLIGFFPKQKTATEWRWNLVELEELQHDWSPRQWISSGWNEPEAQRSRGKVFEALRSAPDAGSISWIRRLHGSHSPEEGPFSTCMHRADAVTVSYTEIEVDHQTGLLRYWRDCPCRLGGLEVASLPLR